MNRIVIIGANDFQNPLILKAKEMGYETHVFAWKEGAVGENTADFFYPISIINKEEILEVCKQIVPDAILSIGSDLASITVNYLARHLGLPCNSEYSTFVSTNKYEMRKAFLNAGVPVPEFHVVDLNSNRDIIHDMDLPVIVKPTDRSGSRGITKVEVWEDLEKGIEDAIKNSFEKKAIVEEYLEGDEYSCECISFEGKHNLLAVTKKFTTGHPHFIETGHLEPSGLCDDIIEKVKMHIFHALDALEIRYGASHSEFKIDENGQIHIIEIGARMGGDCIGSDLVLLSTGIDYLKMAIQVATGERPKFVRVREPKIAIIKFIFSKEEYDNYLRISSHYPDKLYYASKMHIDEEQKIVDSGSRYGFYILACESIEEAMEITKL